MPDKYNERTGQLMMTPEEAHRRAQILALWFRWGFDKPMIYDEAGRVYGARDVWRKCHQFSLYD